MKSHAILLPLAQDMNHPLGWQVPAIDTPSLVVTALPSWLSDQLSWDRRACPQVTLAFLNLAPSAKAAMLANPGTPKRRPKVFP